MLKTINIGIDDTDSNSGMCTTYLGAVIVDFLIKNGVEFLDFPKLIRLNPNIPYKTRGNGAVNLTFMIDDNKIANMWEGLIELVSQYSDISAENTHPGMVLVEGEIPKWMTELYKKALYDVIELEDLKKQLSQTTNLKYFYLKKGRGLIGASASIGAFIDDDYTFELITYRVRENLGKPRKIDEESVIIADNKVPLSFNNVDYEHGKAIMITPKGPDPVYCGIRGETATSVIDMWRLIKPREEIERIMIYRSNQHTKVHFPKEFSGKELKPFLSVKTRGTVITKPRDIAGGHVIFSLQTKDGTIIDCAAYEPTKKYRKTIRLLVPDDEIIVFGGIRKPEKNHRLTINLEEIEITKLNYSIDNYDKRPPKCPNCGLTLKSAGENAGFKCKRCSYKTRKKNYIYYPKPRGLKTGIRYVTPICAHRHLTKPVSRDLILQFNNQQEKNFAEQFNLFLTKRKNLLEIANKNEKQ